MSQLLRDGVRPFAIGDERLRDARRHIERGSVLRCDTARGSFGQWQALRLVGSGDRGDRDESTD